MGYTDNALCLITDAEPTQTNRWEIPFARASIYWRQKKFALALDQAEKACVEASWHPPVWRLIAMVQSSIGTLSDAEASTRRAKMLSERRKELVRAVIPKPGVFDEEVRVAFIADFADSH
jgi:hypothetical protein